MIPAARNAVSIFGTLAQQNDAIGGSLTVRCFREGETVCEAGAMAKAVSLVASGRVQLYRTRQNGGRFVIATLGPGSIFGETALLGGEGLDTCGVALEPCTVLPTSSLPKSWVPGVKRSARRFRTFDVGDWWLPVTGS